MRLPVASLLLALGLVMAGGEVRAATPTKSVNTYVTAAKLQLDGWKSASARVQTTRARQADLEARIDTLKRRGGAAPGLQNLLQTSVSAERELARALEAQSVARGRVEGAVRLGVQRIDADIRALVPALKTGAVASRREAARRINELRAARQALRETARALETTPAGPPRDWATYQVHIEPLDGPVELEEKADFVEDTRDKLAKKRRALAGLLAEARQEKQIARAARDFDTYVRIFDEEARTDRVTRQNGATAGAQTTAETSDDSSQQPSAGLSNSFQGNNRNDGANSPDPTAPPTDTTNEAAPDTPLAGGAGTDKMGAGQNPTGPTVNTPDSSAPPVARDLNAELLINLRVSQLAAQDLDVATLERLVRELEELDRYLKGQASSIRKRARAIEADEARDLRK